MLAGPHIVAAVQFEPGRLDVRANVALMEQLVFEAAAKGARMVVLPELCTSGTRVLTAHEAASCAQGSQGHVTQRMMRLATRFDCYVVFGYVESCGGRLFNSAAIVGPSGLVGNAQKHNLWGTDHLWAQRSEAIAPIVPTPIGRLGVLIGRDVMNTWRSSKPFAQPDFRFYRQGSVDVVCLPTSWSDHEGGLPDSQWVDFAEETRANVVVANACGKLADGRVMGGSCVIDRTLRVWTHGGGSNEVVVGGVMIS